MASNLKSERTLLLVKPDGVKRGLIGEVILRMEQRGLKVIALKMVQPTVEHIEGFLPKSDKWLERMGNKTLGTYEQYKMDPIKELGTKDPLKIGKMIKKWLVGFWLSGPVVAMVISGIHAIDMVRKIVGNTIPAKAEMGTIRGDYSVDSPILANIGKRAIHNVIHASGDIEEATHETEHWFSPEEIHDYKRAEEDIMF
ncbi:nucleoside-diphosphate kinase [Patescibacteria group bacterium]|nr:nucleoside-diphosphate kinase [Patescibacteria group bacterium]MBU4000391.1 nucleoside-diphosphate kinase [Patescibacteria group bacterium]MBU4056885.1 nucleoside-diphosphate kinase [Patescibacteria group bacterium]MBU4368629.1 nucleoside-diphosphate kinase [Patescibacteria group bacterium]